MESKTEANGNSKQPMKRWDAFLSHASEDKESLARPLAISLNRLGATVWYDEFALRLGDSLSRSIDLGLAESCYGLVIISPHFIQKPWTEYELRGLTSLEIEQGRVIIPIWHGVTRHQVLKFSPPLADKFALCTNGITPETVAIQILREIRPDLYANHPRSELERLASGEALKGLQTELAHARSELSVFKCPVCGAPVAQRGPMFGGDDAGEQPFLEAFECGYQEVNDYPYRLCPSDPNFPAFEDFGLEFEHLENHSPNEWICTAQPKTEHAKKVDIYPVLGTTRDEVERRIKEVYSRAATRYRH